MKNRRTEMYQEATTKTYEDYISVVTSRLNNGIAQTYFFLDAIPLLGVLRCLITDGFNVTVLCADAGEEGDFELIIDAENNKEEGPGKLFLIGCEDFERRCKKAGLEFSTIRED